MRTWTRLSLLLLVFACLFAGFSNSLIASAASIGVNINPDNYAISDVQCIASGSETWKKPSSYVFNTDDDGSGFLSIVDQAPVYWRAKFTPLESAGSLTVEPSMYLDCTMFYLQTSSPNYAMTPDGAMYVTTATGTVYEFPVTNVVEILNSSGTLAGYNVSFGGSVEVGSGFETGDCTIEFVCSGISNTGCVQVNLYQCTFIVTENPVTTNTAKIVESVDKAAQDIMANDDANTEEIKDKLDEVIENDDDNAETTHGFLRQILDTIINLPSKLWELISDGLKSLFVPDEQFMTDYSDKWNELLEDRFGAVFQAVNIIFGCWDDISAADQTNTIDMPEVTIPLPEGNSFTFGGFAVQIVPDGFDFLVGSVKMIIGIVCTALFLNGLKSRYNEIMEGTS